MGRSAKSWSRKATTFRWATRSASSSFPALVRDESWIPDTSEPMDGVRWVMFEPAGRRFLNIGSAARPGSVWVNGSRGGYFSEWSHVGR